jgi:cobalt-zinc-cadmium resistance protein CzcA
MEESDVIITLKPKREWVSAQSKDELADQFKEALTIIPGMEVEFTQPIEMRFNELITGVRADIAIKIFGEDLDVLNKKANEIKKIIANVEGAADITVEKIAGLPQMNVKFDRSKIARYGLNIADLNKLISTGFAGTALGSVFEGEKRFDLVVRLDKDKRKDISNLENLYVDISAGGKIPLSEIATISYTEGAAKISRDDTKRRIVVGINVRNRDLQSVVDDVQNLIDKKIILPVGYSITYGGQFENLQSAKDRLKVAVPIALILIFILLYFAFSSVKEALIIFTAIPLSAVGGVLLLWLRDLPFSISAGVGFIALFGIAVLNGIVLIEHFKELKQEDDKDNKDELIIKAAKSRLRAVLLTASAAALGFLPMAVSTNAGAEVQRPLATVVIGGLVTSTLLTLVLLPVLYSIFHSLKAKKIRKRNRKTMTTISILLLLISFQMEAQEQPLNFEEIRTLALENNSSLKAASFKVKESDALIGSAFNFEKTTIYYNYDESNLALNNDPLHLFGVQQNFLFPSVYFADKRVQKANSKMVRSTYELKKQALLKEVSAAYYRLQFEQEKGDVYRHLDSLYAKFAYAAQRRFELGETNYLEKITAQAKQKQLQIQYQQAQEDILAAYAQLNKLVQSDTPFTLVQLPFEKLQLKKLDTANAVGTEFYENKKSFFKAKKDFEKQQLLPDISIEYFQGSNPALNDNLYGYQIGLKIPLLFGGKSSKIKASKMAAMVAQQEAKEYKVQLNTNYLQLITQLKKYTEALSYYETDGKSLSEEILKTASLSYQNGEIDFFQYIQSIENGYEIRLSYLNSLNTYNQTIIAINYLN